MQVAQNQRLELYTVEATRTSLLGSDVLEFLPHSRGRHTVLV